MVNQIGINGFGRIGRAIYRVLLENNYNGEVVINDINPDNNNIAYQLKYDSLYGILNNKVYADEEMIFVDEKKIPIYHYKTIDEVPWNRHKIKIVIDASGVHENLIRSRNLKGKVRNVIITHSPEHEYIDRYVIMGVNENEINFDTDFIISSSICDANAFGPVVNVLEKEWGIKHGFITTLHPWLSYQNLLDGQSQSILYPGKTFSHYILGRASTYSIMPKPTTTVDATCKVLPWLDDKFFSFSFRVPTATVSCSDISVELKKKVSVQQVTDLFEEQQNDQINNIFNSNYEPLVSIDFKGSSYSATIDQRWTSVNDNNYLKLILWYDNEWGYSNRVYDLIKLLSVKI
jgi:glyceraldehyde 3-phosphate dehydrogenase|tara:strand:- start:164 stop:1204 length:1041 start_codon:yes stop_codon:yes gene_type:complete